MNTRWIKSTVLLAGMTLSCAALFAQQATTPAATTQPATTSARLSAEQKQQLMEMRATARDQAAIIRNDQTLTPEQKQQKLQELHANTREQMKAILTPEQQQAFAARRTARQAKVAAKLGITADQQNKLKELFQSTRQQRQAVLTNSGLTNDQKQTQLTQIRQNAKAQMATILTPDQLTKFQQMHWGRMRAKAGNM
jgi:Spy/CpxP family protein refolding chaperone